MEDWQIAVGTTLVCDRATGRQQQEDLADSCWNIAVGTNLVTQLCSNSNLPSLLVAGDLSRDRSSEYVAVHSSGYDTSVRWLTSSCDGVRSADGKSDARPSMPVCHAEEIAESTSASLSV
jgi:hypothetical protein